MVLLLPSYTVHGKRPTTKFTFQYGSINTLVVKLFGLKTTKFTFQYGSINTIICIKIESIVINLHSNIVLLILSEYLNVFAIVPIYIPIWFY